jgi:hypothetical protein
MQLEDKYHLKNRASYKHYKDEVLDFITAYVDAYLDVFSDVINEKHLSEDMAIRYGIVNAWSHIQKHFKNKSLPPLSETLQYLNKWKMDIIFNKLK